MRALHPSLEILYAHDFASDNGRHPTSLDELVAANGDLEPLLSRHAGGANFAMMDGSVRFVVCATPTVPGVTGGETCCMDEDYAETCQPTEGADQARAEMLFQVPASGEACPDASRPATIVRKLTVPCPSCSSSSTSPARSTVPSIPFCAARGSASAT